MLLKKIANIFVWICELFILFAGLALIIIYTWGNSLPLFVFILLLGYLLNIICTIILINQNRSILGKISWIFFMCLIPIIGHIFYFTFGSKFKSKREMKIEKSGRYDILKFQKAFPNIDDKTLENLARLNRTKILGANYEFYSDGHHFFQALFAQMYRAKKTINIISYILKPGEILDTFCTILINAANKGVKVKWLIDDFGRGLVKPEYFKQIKQHDNIKVVMISKVIYPFIHSANFYRNHQKFVTIDNEYVFAGGSNLSDEYVSLSKKYGRWIDLNYQITGNQVNRYEILFYKLWKLWAKELIDIEHILNIQNIETKSNSILIHDSPVYDVSTLEINFIQLLSRAKEKIKLVTPYFSVTTAIMNILEVILRSGVQIDLYFSGLPDKKIIYNISLYELRKLQKLGLNLYIYDGCFLHSKCGVIDNEIAFFGSSNMDMRSMYAQYEIIDIVTGQAVHDIQQIIAEYHENSTLDTQNINKKTNWITKTFYEAIKPLA